MSDLPDDVNITTSHMPDALETPSCPACGTPWIWIILFIAALLAIVGLVVWIVWLYHRNSDAKGQQIELAGANITVASPTSITGTWTAIKNTNTKVTLYATLHPPIFNADGTLGNSSVSNGKNQAVAASAVNTVTLSGLNAGTKYYATLIATNSKSSNYQVYTQLVFMESITPLKATTTPAATFPFRIGDILQVGNVQIGTETTSTSGIYAVNFLRSPDCTNSEFFINTQGQIQSSSSSLNDICLFSDSGTNNGNLIAKSCGTASTPDSLFTYGQGPYANQWCLSSTVNSATPTCWVLGGITNGIAPISVTNTSNVGDAWTNTLVTTP